MGKTDDAVTELASVQRDVTAQASGIPNPPHVLGWKRNKSPCEGRELESNLTRKWRRLGMSGSEGNIGGIIAGSCALEPRASGVLFASQGCAIVPTTKDHVSEFLGSAQVLFRSYLLLVQSWVWPSTGSAEHVRRTRSARLTSLSAAAAQGAGVLVGVVTIPIAVRYLGPERYGVWLTLHSLLIWASVMDLGLGGNALINALADAKGRDDTRWAQELVSTAFLIVGGLVLAVSIIFLAVFPHIGWSRVFNVSGAVPSSELELAMFIAWAGFALTVPMGITVGASNGFQVGYVANLWNTASALLGLVAIWMATRTTWGLPGLFFASWGTRLACTLGCLLHLFGGVLPELRPRPRASARASRRLVSLGLRYFVGQIAGLGLFFSQPMIISQTLGPEKAGVFGVAQRLVTLPLTLLQVLMHPLMPAYGEARARGDWVWIKSTLRHSLMASALIVLGLGVPTAVLTPWIARAWAGPAMVPEPWLVSALGIYVGINGMLIPISVMLFGVERVSGQVAIAATNAGVTVFGSLWLAPRLGLTGVATAMVLGMFLVNATGQMVELRAVRDANPRAST